MPSIKRSISPVELDAPRKTRSTRKPAAGVSTPSTSTSLVSPDVQALQSQFEELQSFVLSQDLLHKTSPSTRKHVDLHPDAAKSHANIVRGLIDEKILAIENDSPNRIDQTEKRDAAMLEYIPEVGRLAEMPGGLQLACDLLIYLSAQSYCHKNFDQDKNDRTRPSDSSADVLLLHILERLHEEDKIFLVSKYLDVLEPHVKFFEQKEARPYLEQSFGRLSSWNKGSGIAQRTYERLRKEIVAMRGGLDNACSKHHIPTKVWYARTLVSRCEEFLPKIRRLGNLENGLLLAFDLFLFLSRQSYFESGVVEPWLQQLKPHDTFIDILDDMLMETAVRIREADPDFQPEDALEKLQGEVEYWDTILEEECLVDSFRILSSWIPLSAKKWAKEKHDEIQADILKEQRRIEKRYRNCRDDGRAPPFGLPVAADLAIYIEDYNYSKAFDKSHMQQILSAPRSPAGPMDTLLDSLIDERFDPASKGMAEDILQKIRKSNTYIRTRGTSNYFNLSLKKLDSIIYAEDPRSI
ncbi:hypothetical protein GLAREA_07227 [Glarea lozoyensis ATCC 20868]|uniref:Uncharacterized protein n=1 Tax=Glarea lozoyensis (strain ATCC 20868 / MF5171) TaxID=1116229 RepID=S3DAS6_GLAL2|nr:uncharacterized protein GLAREA_07227 [Glarea lozoyensis ATCC 20868]EPE34214.1 hypothetical protein GLAREA_07227 [Glarea lozoyensis ATCC 20868]